MAKRERVKVLKMFFRKTNVGTLTESVDCWTEEVRLEDANKWRPPEDITRKGGDVL